MAWYIHTIPSESHFSYRSKEACNILNLPHLESWLALTTGNGDTEDCCIGGLQLLDGRLRQRLLRLAAAADGSQDLTRRLTWGAKSAKLNETTTLMPHISRTKRTDNMNFSTRIKKNILSQHAKSWYSRENIVLLGVVLTCHLGMCIPAKKRMPSAAVCHSFSFQDKWILWKHCENSSVCLERNFLVYF